MKIIIIGGLIIAILFLISKQKEAYDGPSLAFDPSTRAGIAGIGPREPRQNPNEGFCGSCM